MLSTFYLCILYSFLVQKWAIDFCLSLFNKVLKTKRQGTYEMNLKESNAIVKLFNNLDSDKDKKRRRWQIFYRQQ